jgi:hypothetical protein
MIVWCLWPEAVDAGSNRRWEASEGFGRYNDGDAVCRALELVSMSLLGVRGGGLWAGSLSVVV